MLTLQEYSETSNSEPDVDLENQYYSSKALKEADPKTALESFQRVLDLEEDKGDWGFKALKQMIKINFRQVLISDSGCGKLLKSFLNHVFFCRAIFLK